MECRTPLEMKVEVPPPPPGQSSTPEAFHKENQPQHERMSPALLRRQQLVQNRYGRHPPNLTPPKPPPPQSIKQRLPLPKNAVLLSLIQASEPARRRTNVDSPPDVPPQINRESSTEKFQVSPAPAPPATPPSTKILLPKFSKSSALFVDTGLTAPSSSSECKNDDDDNEEHQIRVGTYLEGGPCGTYAVAVKTGLLVYPTLFEHALPNSVGNNNSKVVSSSIADQADHWKRDVDELVKNSYWKKQQLQMKQQECEDKKLPSRTQSSKFSSTHFEGRADDEWEAEASIDDEVKSSIGMRLTASLSIENSENRDDDLPASSSTFSPNDDSNLNRTVPLTNTMSFTRQLSVPITPQRHKTDSFDDFDRPLIRLKYGDRVQVVSMDSRGWVKLARGYGYIRLQNDKQLVKVGGTSDRACQIEATLHELSIERDRLKNEQTKLERLSAGLMIDLQSTLLTSDDHVICSAPEGMPRIDSDLDLLAREDLSINSRKPSLDDISVNSRSPKPVHDSPTSAATQEIRISKSHSPSRVTRMRGINPPSPPPTDPRLSTPTRVNFRTGMSGHRALLSSNTHPHDFIGTPGSVRSMSNHSGISRGKSRPRASIY